MAARRLAAAATRRRGLAPVLAIDTRVLILGSFPGEASLAAQAYYAHPRNHFWPLLAAIVGEALPAMTYEARIARLLAHRIGVWDTIVACVREGSLDAAIRAPSRAQSRRVLVQAPNIALVCFNGRTAARAMRQWSGAGYSTLSLPSSSPAYTRPFAEKLVAWRVIADHL
ncbi:MAG: DNA-deoxyinosine glycosylase [Burkholderiales bacterium]|nr:DNA-deoxyinosine glycosylase [Burkholderiales bacterium]